MLDGDRGEASVNQQQKQLGTAPIQAGNDFDQPVHFLSPLNSPLLNLYAGRVETLAKRRLVMVTGRCHPALAMDIADKLGISLTEANLREFADGEIHCRFDESIRGAHVFIVQTHATPVNDSVMEQLIMIDAAKRASAKSITAVIPNYG